jgi:DNA-binding NarL/FixJ family response regulator
MLVRTEQRNGIKMMKQAWSLLIGRPGPLRDGLGYLLVSMAQTKEVGYEDDVASALSRSNEPHPNLVLLIADTSSIKLGQALGQLRLKWPLASYVVMVEDEHDLQMAQAAGADKALLKGCRADRLVEAIELMQTH